MPAWLKLPADSVRRRVEANFGQTSTPKHKKPLKPRKKNPRRIKTAAQAKKAQRTDLPRDNSAPNVRRK